MAEKNFRNTAFVFAFFILTTIWGCQEENPISGFYASSDEHFAVVHDSTLYLIYNPDTAIAYQLNTYKILDSDFWGEDINMRGYHVNFKYNLTMEEGSFSGPFECPFPFNYDSLHSAYGGTLMAWFLSEDLHINGITFEKVEDSLYRKIHSQWENLVFRNEVSLDQRMNRKDW